MSASTSLTGTVAGRAVPAPLGDGVGIVDFKALKGGIEHFAARHDDDIERRSVLAWPALQGSEEFSRQPFRTIPINGGTQLPTCSHPESASGAGIGEHEDRHEPPVDSRSLLVDSFELGAAAHPLTRCQPTALRHGLPLVGNRQTLPPLRTTALQDDASVLRRHTNSEPMRLLPAAPIRLVRSFSLHDPCI
jgi:hypothetical protein